MATRYAIAQDSLPLFGEGDPAPDRSFGWLVRHQLSDASWIDYQPTWLAGANRLQERLENVVPWSHHQRPMYERIVDEPRLTAWYEPGSPWPDDVLDDVAAVLSARYGRPLRSLSMNLYRDGADSVAWHGDRIGRRVEEPVVAIVSLGAPRPFLVRPKGGGARSRSFSPGWGDLLVMGGRCQQEFDHGVPKIAAARPRLSVMLREVDDHPPGLPPVAR